jgi:uncharacterized membrane protein HdeD (DUF308 family)
VFRVTCALPYRNQMLFWLLLRGSTQGTKETQVKNLSFEPAGIVWGIVTLIFGLLVLIFPYLLSYVVGIYLIIVGLWAIIPRLRLRF